MACGAEEQHPRQVPQSSGDFGRRKQQAVGAAGALGTRAQEWVIVLLSLGGAACAGPHSTPIGASVSSVGFPVQYL